LLENPISAMILAGELTAGQSVEADSHGGEMSLSATPAGSVSDGVRSEENAP